MLKLIAITPLNAKYKSKVNKALKAIRAYHALDDNSTENQEEKLFNKYMELLEDLPKREVNHLQKEHKKEYGYNF